MAGCKETDRKKLLSCSGMDPHKKNWQVVAGWIHIRKIGKMKICVLQFDKESENISL